VIRRETVRVTTTGSAGSASGSATTAAIVGELLNIYLNYHASAPATTDTTITAATDGYTIYGVTNTVTDALVAPSAAPATTAGAAITNAHRPIAVGDRVTIALAQCDALTDALVATVVWRV
jgi:hypothetical protein